MPRFACPACGDPNAYPFWIDSEPPVGCPNEPERVSGICGAKIRDAERAALWRKTAPEAFDTMGNILPGGLAVVLSKLYPREVQL